MGWPDGHTIVANWSGKGNPPVDPRYHRAPDGLAGRSHDRGGVAHYRKSTRAASVDHDETWVPDDLANTLNGFDIGDARTVELVTGGGGVSDDGLPLGLDSHRYRCCGNGVVSSVAEWIGLRLADYFRALP
jgi:site-specific DNA-cytosine methylase